jgi:hypothetical protein
MIRDFEIAGFLDVMLHNLVDSKNDLGELAAPSSRWKKTR